MALGPTVVPLLRLGFDSPLQHYKCWERVAVPFVALQVLGVSPIGAARLWVFTQSLNVV